jgi:hypothetical protein
MGFYSGEGGMPRFKIRWDGRIVRFHALTRYWSTSVKGIKANAAFGTKYHSDRAEKPVRDGDA